MAKDDVVKFERESFDFVKAELAQHLLDSFKELLRKKGLDIPGDLSLSSFIQILERPPESHLGDYAFPCFRFAKTLRTSPQKIAAELSEEFLSRSSSFVEECKVLGAFLNIFLVLQL